jgi:CheY-like chemotaxis protein
MPDLSTTCYRIKSLHHIPLALIIRSTASEWEKTRYLDIDGYIPLSATTSDLFYHIEAIRILSRQRPDPVKSAISVLVITPDPATQQSVRVAFRYYWPDSRILVPGSGEIAVSLAIQQSPDIVLLDIRLPDLPSLAILKRLRTFCQAPVIMMMENQDEEVVIRAMNAGADDYMVKPIRKVELMARVRENLKRAMAAF